MNKKVFDKITVKVISVVDALDPKRATITTTVDTLPIIKKGSTEITSSNSFSTAYYPLGLLPCETFATAKAISGQNRIPKALIRYSLIGATLVLQPEHKFKGELNSQNIAYSQDAIHYNIIECKFAEPSKVISSLIDRELERLLTTAEKEAEAEEETNRANAVKSLADLLA